MDDDGCRVACRSALLNLDCFWYNTSSSTVLLPTIADEWCAANSCGDSFEKKNRPLFSLSHISLFRIAIHRTYVRFFRSIFFVQTNCFVCDSILQFLPQSHTGTGAGSASIFIKLSKGMNGRINELMPLKGWMGKAYTRTHCIAMPFEGNRTEFIRETSLALNK